MLNKNQERELAYVITVNEIRPIPGKDRVECAVVNGWTCMVPRNVFKKGDPGIYFEIDSKLPAHEPFMFLEKKKFHIKTQKYKAGDGQFWSQGLLMAAADFGWTIDNNSIVDDKGVRHTPNDESAFLTEQLGVTYYEVEDQKRKAKDNPDARINAALARHPAIAKRWGRLIKKVPILRKLFLLFYEKKKDSWPVWVQKTDEERVQNIPWILEDKTEWIATEKIDGTSTTFTYRKHPGFKKDEYYVCSRNVVMDRPDKPCFYDKQSFDQNNGIQEGGIGNVYLEMDAKYQMKTVCKALLDNDFPKADWITIQGETYGNGVQKRDYSTKNHDLAVFNLITSDQGRINTLEMKRILDRYNIPCVPIVNDHFVLPDTVEELLTMATGNSVIDGKPREGLVFRYKDGTKSFKAVSNEFLEKFHN